MTLRGPTPNPLQERVGASFLFYFCIHKRACVCSTGQKLYKVFAAVVKFLPSAKTVPSCLELQESCQKNLAYFLHVHARTVPKNQLLKKLGMILARLLFLHWAKTLHTRWHSFCNIASYMPINFGTVLARKSAYKSGQKIDISLPCKKCAKVFYPSRTLARFMREAHVRVSFCLGKRFTYAFSLSFLHRL